MLATETCVFVTRLTPTATRPIDMITRIAETFAQVSTHISSHVRFEPCEGKDNKKKK